VARFNGADDDDSSSPATLELDAATGDLFARLRGACLLAALAIR
jgi:hypothetical protein